MKKQLLERKINPIKIMKPLSISYLYNLPFEKIINQKLKSLSSVSRYLCGIFLFFLFLSNCTEKNPHGFSKGLMPIKWEGKLESSKECGNCHKEIYEEWKTTRHRVAFTNELYKESHEREPLTWCVNCHAPMVKTNGDLEKIEDRVFTEEGISCIVCHKRGDKILTAHTPSKPKEHEYIEVKEMKRSEFCENCHQFNFPVGTGNVPHKNFKYSNQPMQNTFTEWQMSYFYGKETCQDCHMQPKEGYKTHFFPGGHNRDYLSKSFSVSLSKVSNSSIKLTVIGKRLGHAFPTGDLFRTLIVKLLDKKQNEIKRVVLRYEYDEIEANRNSDILSAKQLRERNIITPPVSREDAFYIKIFSISNFDLNRIDSYELSMNYINESNKLFSNVEDNHSKLIFKRESIQLVSKISEP